SDVCSSDLSPSTLSNGFASSRVANRPNVPISSVPGRCATTGCTSSRLPTPSVINHRTAIATSLLLYACVVPNCGRAEKITTRRRGLSIEHFPTLREVLLRQILQWWQQARQAHRPSRQAAWRFLK